MQKLIIILLSAITLVASISGRVHAGSFEDNPDRYPSIGLSIGLQGLAGQSEIKGAGLSDQDVSSGIFDITLDSTIPVSPSVSFFGAFSLIGESVKYKENSDFFESQTDAAGFGLRLGARLYFNR